MFEDLRATRQELRVRVRAPRLARPCDGVLLTDLSGVILDVATPGRPSAKTSRAGARPGLAQDEVVFDWRDVGVSASGSFWLVGLHAGAALRTATPEPATALAPFVDQLNAPFLAPTSHPICTPREAAALGLTAEDVVSACMRDLWGEAGRSEDIDALAAAVRTGQKDWEEVFMELAASDLMATRIFGRARAPAVSALRMRSTYAAQIAHRLAAPLGDASRVAATVEDAFRALGAAFDPTVWRAAHFEAILREEAGSAAAFGKRADPVSLISV